MAQPPDLTHLLPLGDLVLRLGVATAAGAIIGLNRELQHKSAGLRTQALVSLGSATAMLVISELTMVSQEFDVSALSRVIQGILTGIGFLGAGVIIRGHREGEVQGLTTAASIWISATLGLACGVGLWRLALLVLGASLVVLYAGIWFERLLRTRPRPEVPPPSS